MKVMAWELPHCSLFCSLFLPWVVLKFVPIGDLLSDYIGSGHPFRGRSPTTTASCPEALFSFMRVLLAVGTVIDTIPEFALLLAILSGAICCFVLGGAYLEVQQSLEELGLLNLLSSLLEHLW